MTNYLTNIKVDSVEDAFIRRNGIHIDETQYTLTIKSGNESKSFNGTYGSTFNVFNHEIKVKDCATGTRDWKSFVLFQIESVK